MCAASGPCGVMYLIILNTSIRVTDMGDFCLQFHDMARSDVGWKKSTF